ncbi:hypothetical protein LPB140_03885 [Sphingorhabdus lutea]|uniref:Thioesterase domain-containing protein n=2 Tax=Sphingorhabdus lutea TaxID=1913578 RepID=A0A1L3JEJ7_9SPHN|nr:hypothetical protein LPB140_03885 [Sphingorhabdus lutea]
MNKVFDQLPPYAAALGVEILGQENNMPIITMPYSDKVAGRPGYWHGGAMSAILEMAAIAAIMTKLNMLDDEISFKQVNVTVDFLRGGVQAPIQAVGIITRIGRTLANVEAVAWQDDRHKLVASAQMHYLLEAAGK